VVFKKFLEDPQKKKHNLIFRNFGMRNLIVQRNKRNKKILRFENYNVMDPMELTPKVP
jgi:hypothetical protein